MAHDDDDDVQARRLESEESSVESVQSPDSSRVQASWNRRGATPLRRWRPVAHWPCTGPARGERAAPLAPRFEPVCGAPARRLRLRRRGGRAAKLALTAGRQAAAAPPQTCLKERHARRRRCLAAVLVRLSQLRGPLLATAGPCRTSAGPPVRCGHCGGTGLQ